MGHNIFSPAFPASCPWVTTVGGTQIGRNKTVFDPEKVANVYKWRRDDGTLRAFQQWASGGGFSKTFDAPEYQRRTLADCFENHNPGLPSFQGKDWQATDGLYNRKGHGLPDISASGWLLRQS